MANMAVIARCARPLSGSFSRSAQPIGTHLPGQAELVLQPSARALFASFGELVPVVVDLFLVGAVDQQRDRFVERELGAAVDGRVLLAVEHEIDGQHAAGRARARLAVVRDVGDLRVREHRDIELGGLDALRVEPEVGGDAGHGELLVVGVVFYPRIDRCIHRQSSASRRMAKARFEVAPTRPGTTTHTRWDALEELLVTDTYLFARATTISGYVIPRRSLRDAGDVDRLIGWRLAAKAAASENRPPPPRYQPTQ